MSVYREITVFGMLYHVFGHKYCVWKYFDFGGPLIHVVKKQHFYICVEAYRCEGIFRHRNGATILLTWSFLFTFLALFGHYWFIILVYFTFVHKMWWKNCCFGYIFVEIYLFFWKFDKFFDSFWLDCMSFDSISTVFIHFDSFRMVLDLFWLIFNRFHANL